MSTLLMRLAAPLQAWGTRSRFVYRHTEIAPTKSGVIGMLAAARGLRRTDPLTELLGLDFGVRIDQPGQRIRDFQVARTLDGSDSMPLSFRYYLADAAFLAAVCGPRDLLDSLAAALNRPHFPVYLGRRSCPPAGHLNLGVHDGDLTAHLRTWPWQASPHHQRRHHAPTVRLEILRDARPDETITEPSHDEPLSFDPAHRQHAWRRVVRLHTDITNPRAKPLQDHDPMEVLEG
ncbi:type I-E CRISPR-associated protein Cas5/CasD [Mangrovihabitans endophyticus]|uniref:Type I-E CRISPR-associated protein Cas5/CasD n=1 Tax=Mangrovihabitans endophyticus TaxID=1751298 RepID=A0A8J3C6B6_9ACTN|nr:type I-E CRISPR-associated protein Cas5/CasD [Mangrovihabitans endophyticus]GGL20488.1 type I-E CRISPR-associated protein Cas5/CasD [Mangrovihabitans endophyticus]